MPPQLRLADHHRAVFKTMQQRISNAVPTLLELRARRQSLLSSLRMLLNQAQAQSARLRQEWERASTEAHQLPLAVRLQTDFGMTPREAEVALLLAEGLSNTAVARRLGISPHTARHHTQRVLGKLGVHSRAEAGARLRR